MKTEKFGRNLRFTTGLFCTSRHNFLNLKIARNVSWSLNINILWLKLILSVFKHNILRNSGTHNLFTRAIFHFYIIIIYIYYYYNYYYYYQIIFQIPQVRISSKMLAYGWMMKHTVVKTLPSLPQDPWVTCFIRPRNKPSWHTWWWQLPVWGNTHMIPTVLPLDPLWFLAALWCFPFLWLDCFRLWSNFDIILYTCILLLFVLVWRNCRWCDEHFQNVAFHYEVILIVSDSIKAEISLKLFIYLFSNFSIKLSTFCPMRGQQKEE